MLCSSAPTRVGSGNNFFNRVIKSKRGAVGILGDKNNILLVGDKSVNIGIIAVAKESFTNIIFGHDPHVCCVGLVGKNDIFTVAAYSFTKSFIIF